MGYEINDDAVVLAPDAVDDIDRDHPDRYEDTDDNPDSSVQV